MYNTINKMNNQRYRFNSHLYNKRNKSTSNLETNMTPSVQSIITSTINVTENDNDFESKAKEQHAREKEQQTREKEQQERVKQAREQQAREQQAREQQERVKQARAKEQQARAKEQQVAEQEQEKANEEVRILLAGMKKINERYRSTIHKL